MCPRGEIDPALEEVRYGASITKGLPPHFFAPIAQSDRATAFEAVGFRFES